MTISQQAGAELIVSICIPTYNRAALLKRCLDRLLPQTRGKFVEVVVIDNASTDQTEAVVRDFLEQYPGIRYIRNPRNLGYLGSQELCVLEGRGKYTAILCDDDVYAPNALDVILPVLSGGDYAFVALNYYSFICDPDRVQSVISYAESFKSDDAYDVWDFPSVGHYSGFVLNTRLAQTALPRIWQLFTRAQYEQMRGILAAVVVCAIKAGNLPGYFIGEPVVGAGIPEQVDYDLLNHICMDTYRFLYVLRSVGLLTQQNIARREAEVLRMLPKALLRNGGYLTEDELQNVTETLHGWFSGDERFTPTASILRLMRFSLVRALFRLIVSSYIPIRWFKRQWKAKWCSRTAVHELHKSRLVTV